jgi:hypothetical protein
MGSTGGVRRLCARHSAQEQGREDDIRKIVATFGKRRAVEKYSYLAVVFAVHQREFTRRTQRGVLQERPYREPGDAIPAAAMCT